MLPNFLPSKIFLSLALTTISIGTNQSKASEQIPRKASEQIPPTTGIVVAQSDRELTDLARQVHQQINEYRNSLNLTPLTLNAQISEQAKNHSENMAQRVVKFSHQGFDNRIEALEDELSYRSAAENVAQNMGYGDPVSKAVAGWIKSEGHRQNIVGDYNLTGIGVAKNQQGEYYFTQIFILEN
ncbi:CAP domain-containing protein [Pleurocapsales cyanobacterium LEGE 10410]|nr:CAP domain-containing protein [Pleurocapsales cyanobacterium LEGE 10410]